MPVVVGGVFLLVLIAFVVAFVVNRSPGGGQPINNIRCESGEQLATHYHAHVDILFHGQPANITASTGVRSDCLYWIHTHDTTGIVHVEAPKQQASREFTLGDFFAIWNQPLSSTQVATFPVRSGEQLKIWVNGQLYAGDPSKIVLKSHENVVLEIGPPFTDPPPTFAWDQSQYPQ